MMPVAFLAVDLGSASGRVMVGILRGDTFTVREAGRFANVPVTTEFGLGWDADALWSGVMTGLRAGIDIARAEGAPVRGIGFDSWGVDYARVRPDGSIREFLRHHRDVDAARAARTSGARDVAADYAITGVLDQAINTAHQLRDDEANGIGDAADTLLTIADLFVFRLTGTIRVEASLASTTALVDRRTEDWSEALTAGVRARLPRIAPAGGLAGRTTPERTAELGADEPLDVWFTTAHDTAAAFSAVVDAADVDVAVISSGSWAVAGVALERPMLSEAARLGGFTQEIGARGETLLVKNLSGMWLLQQTMREWADTDGRDAWSVADLRVLLDDAATSAYRGRFDPADPALQAPGALVERLRLACGVPAPTTRADLVRAILESLAGAYAVTLAQVEHLTGRSITEVRIVGGGARNELLCALTAERCRRTVIAGPAEASVHGLLLQLAVAAGDLPDLRAARGITVDDGEPPVRTYPASDTAGIPS